MQHCESEEADREADFEFQGEATAVSTHTFLCNNNVSRDS